MGKHPKGRRSWRLIVEVEAGRPLRTRVQHDNAEDAEAALALAADAARLALPLRRLMQDAGTRSLRGDAA